MAEPTGPGRAARARSLAPGDYGSAREFFVAVRDASVERAQVMADVERMGAREGVRAQGYEPRVSGGATSDPMAPTDARIDYESARGRMVAEDEALIAMAESVIWGGDGGDATGGVAALVGYPAASAAELWSVHALPWAEVARVMGYSGESTRIPKDLFDRACDCVDFFGLKNLVEGRGDAT